ncbi:MAG TPA: biotin/lipoyl-containing protein [Bacillota bacterium]
MSQITADMAGIVAEVKVAPGDEVEPGTEVVVLESMKMQIPVTAGRAGRVREVRVAAGAFVNEGDVLVVLEGGSGG